jgi:HEAT repeat protein
MRRTLALFLLVAVCAPAARGGDEPSAPSQGGVFFREPDSETAARIKDLIGRMATDSVQDRENLRRELESIGFWTVEPLVEVVTRSDKFEPPKQCTSVLVLDAIGDRRAIDPMRAAVARETSHPYIAAFSTLSLGRFRDAPSIPVFRTAARTTKSMDMLKAAVPLALAKIRTDEARDLLLERVRLRGQKERVQSAALLALGFFPECAFAGNAAAPGAELSAALAVTNNRRRGERQAALLGFLVAAEARGDVKPALRDLLAAEKAPEVVRLLLLGLSRSPDADVTEILAQAAARQGDERVREMAADLLYDRVDAATKPVVMQVARADSSARLRAACVLALGRLVDEDVRRLLVEKLTDTSPLVRASAAVALTRRNEDGLRQAAIAAIEPRLKHGETNGDVRADFEAARAVLAGERTDVRWTEVGPRVVFGDMALTYVQRLLREVNLRAMAAIDLAKIQNLQTDSEIAPQGPPSAGDPGEPGEAPGGGDDGGVDPGDGDGPPVPPNDGGPSPADKPVPGVARTSQYQELRDLKVELRRRPHFTIEDLPPPTTTPGGRAK